MDISVITTSIAWLLGAISIFFTIKAAYAFVTRYLSEWKPGMHLSLLSNYCSSMCEYSDKITGKDEPDSCKSKQLVYLDASIKNFGSKDIRLIDPREYVYVTCGDKYRWVSIEESISNPRIFYQSNIEDEHELRFTWDLLKKGEKVRMKLLAECLDPEQKNVTSYFLESLHIEGRKANLHTTRASYLPQERKQAQTRYVWYLSLGLICAFVGLLLLFSDIQVSSQNSMSSRQGVIYSIQQRQQNVENIGIIRYNDKKHINVLFDPLSEEGFRKRYTVDEFNRKYAIMGVDSVLVPRNILLKIVGLILALTGAIIIGINVLRLRALGNKVLEEKYRVLFFQGKTLHMFD